MADTVAIVALVIALIALIAALLQVLQQYTATADGFRRCQPEVMGDWACHTKRNLRLGELRFETIFAVPIIFLNNKVKETYPIKGRPAIDINGTRESYELTLVSQFMEQDSQRSDPQPTASVRHTSGAQLEAAHPSFRQKHIETPKKLDNELVSWIHFLETLQWNQKVFSEHIEAGFQPEMVPAIQISRRSWDFVPADAIKPYAVTNAGDIAIIVQRLGMSWKDFRPGQGAMRAEGNNYLITSTVVRSLGIMLSFSADSHLIDYQERCRNVYVPSLQASLLGFGLVPRSDIAPQAAVGRNPYNAFPVGNAESFDFYLKSFCGRIKAKEAHPTLGGSDSFSVASEFMALVVPVLRMRNSRITRILRPAPNIGIDVVSSQFAMQPFRTCLEAFIPTTEGAGRRRLEVILRKCKNILEHSGWDERNGHPKGYNYNQAERELLDIIHDACDEATAVLREPETRFESLLRSHLCELFVLRDIPLEELAQRYESSISVSREEQIMRYYFDVCRSRTIKQVQMITSLENQSDLLSAYWVTMIFRSLCWYSLHRFKYKFAPVDAQYFESKLPVYIS